ncbi:unnamed protein product [Brachionus calyciflorus]|uniref:Uncharacterized protein n=1 Tax=Brachionus calyciflorus TaxID=104777 RepID=A0A814LCS1_9BILA|nr:unnamed protein product [Brachionus calyciflorus]
MTTILIKENTPPNSGIQISISHTKEKPRTPSPQRKISESNEFQDLSDLNTMTQNSNQKNFFKYETPANKKKFINPLAINKKPIFSIFTPTDKSINTNPQTLNHEVDDCFYNPIENSFTRNTQEFLFQKPKKNLTQDEISIENGKNKQINFENINSNNYEDDLNKKISESNSEKDSIETLFCSCEITEDLDNDEPSRKIIIDRSLDLSPISDQTPIINKTNYFIFEKSKKLDEPSSGDNTTNTQTDNTETSNFTFEKSKKMHLDVQTLRNLLPFDVNTKTTNLKTCGRPLEENELNRKISKVKTVEISSIEDLSQEKCENNDGNTFESEDMFDNDDSSVNNSDSDESENDDENGLLEMVDEFCQRFKSKVKNLKKKNSATSANQLYQPVHEFFDKQTQTDLNSSDNLNPKSELVKRIVKESEPIEKPFKKISCKLTTTAPTETKPQSNVSKDTKKTIELINAAAKEDYNVIQNLIENLEKKEKEMNEKIEKSHRKYMGCLNYIDNLLDSKLSIQKEIHRLQRKINQGLSNFDS